MVYDLESASHDLLLRELHRRMTTAVTVGVEGERAVPSGSGRGTGPAATGTPDGGGRPVVTARRRLLGPVRPVRPLRRYAYIVDIDVFSIARGTRPDDLESRPQHPFLRHLEVGVNQTATSLVERSSSSLLLLLLLLLLFVAVIPARRRRAARGRIRIIAIIARITIIARGSATLDGWIVIFHTPWTCRLHDPPPPRHLLRRQLDVPVIMTPSLVVEGGVVLPTGTVGLVGVPGLRSGRWDFSAHRRGIPRPGDGSPDEGGEVAIILAAVLMLLLLSFRSSLLSSWLLLPVISVAVFIVVRIARFRPTTDRRRPRLRWRRVATTTEGCVPPRRFARVDDLTLLAVAHSIGSCYRCVGGVLGGR